MPWPRGTVCRPVYYTQSEVHPCVFEHEVWPQSVNNFEIAVAKPALPGSYMIDFNLFDEKGNMFGESGAINLNFVDQKINNDPD